MNIRKICYDLYKSEWKIAHIASQDYLNTEFAYLDKCEELAQIRMDMPSYEDYIRENGYKGKGMYETFGEFYVNEYRDRHYMLNLLLRGKIELQKLYEDDLKTFWETDKKNSPKEMQEIIEDMWKFLEDQPFEEKEDYELYLENDYRFTDYHHTAPYEHTFKKGTSRTDIWHWFDEHYPAGVHALLYNE